MRRLLPLVLLAALLAACGSPTRAGDGAAPRSSAAAESPASGERAAVGARGSTDDVPLGNGKEPAGSAKPAAQGSPTAKPELRGDLPMKVRISKTCARPGEPMEVVVETLKGATLGFVVAYSDNRFPPDMYWARKETNTTGTVVWAWIMKGVTPEGRAYLKIVGYKGKKGSAYESEFVVSSTC